jgi:hypothetical protein
MKAQAFRVAREEAKEKAELDKFARERVAEVERKRKVSSDRALSWAGRQAGVHGRGGWWFLCPLCGWSESAACCGTVGAVVRRVGGASGAEASADGGGDA